VTYSFTASSRDTRYYSGTQGDLQVEMGMYGRNHVLRPRFPPRAPPGWLLRTEMWN